MFKWFRRFFTLFVFVCLIGLNILSLTSQLVFSALSGLMDRVPGVQTVSARSKAKAQNQKASVRAMKQRAVSRTKRLAAYQVLEVSNSYIPVVGTAVIVGGSLWEMKQYCDGLNDLNSYLNEFDLDSEEEERGVLESVCNPKFPTLSSASDDFSPNESYEAALLEVGFTDAETLATQIPSAEELQTKAEESSGYQVYMKKAQDYWNSLPDVSDLFDAEEVTSEETEEEGIFDQAKSYMQNLLNEEN